MASAKRLAARTKFEADAFSRSLETTETRKSPVLRHYRIFPSSIAFASLSEASFPSPYAIVVLTCWFGAPSLDFHLQPSQPSLRILDAAQSSHPQGSIHIATSIVTLSSSTDFGLSLEKCGLRQMDFVYEKIAGTGNQFNFRKMSYMLISRLGASRNYNLMKCRRELEKSCSNYKSRASHCPPAPQTTPTSSNPPAPQQEQQILQKKGVLFQTCQETGHTSRRATKQSFQYIESDIQRRATRLKNKSTHVPRPRVHQDPGSNFDPFDGYTGSGFSNDFSTENATAEGVRDSHTRYWAPQKHMSGPRYVPTHAESIAIRQTAALIARHCAVRDKEPYMNSPPQEALHGIRSAVWQARADAQSSRSAEQSPEGNQADNGVRITEDGCIIQHGFDISPLTSSPKSNIHDRCDSACDLQCKTPTHMSPNQSRSMAPIRSSVRNGRGARVPVCFRKQEISVPPTVSTLSALVSGPVYAASGALEQDFIPVPQLQAQESQQKRRMPAPARTALVFVESFSSNAIASDSDYDSDESEKGNDKQEDSALVSALCSDGVNEDGSIANVALLNEPAEIVKTSNRPPQPSVPPSPPSSKIPLSTSPEAAQAQQYRTGTLLPQWLSKLPEPDQQGTPVTTPHDTPIRPPPPQQQHPKPQFPRSRQTAKLFAAHQQQGRPQKPVPAHTHPPCSALDIRRPAPPYIFSKSDNYVTALLFKIEENKGKRPANFKWDHVAPMHGFSPCRPFYVLD